MNRNAPTIIPRKALFGNPEREQVRISRDGSRIGFLAPLDGVMNVWVAPASDPSDARAVTRDAKRGIMFYVWTHNPSILLYIQDTEGDEDWHIYAVNVATDETKDLTPFKGVHATMFPMSPKFPDEALIGLNDRDARYHDIHRVNILTGETSLVLQNDIGAFGFVTDDDFRVLLAAVTTESGGSSFLERPNPDDESGEWRPFMEVGLEDGLTTMPLGTDITGKTLYLADSRNRDTSALASFDLDTREHTILASDARADISWEFLIHPATQRIQAAAFEYERTRWQVLDDSIAPDLERIRAARSGDFRVTSRSQDDSLWIDRLRQRRRTCDVPPLRPRKRRDAIPVRQPPGAGEVRPAPDGIRHRQIAGRLGSRNLLHAARADRRGERTRANRPASSRRTVGAR